ncbi:DUF1190 domain-containing protein [Dokdonella ginsengisoli]|uniref:DUF1190 domain-containing protein n=1 Tax=Dokdonella ginsengisoli TaxID=363846 RepID=A0ABV9QVN4_9GAMM
MKRSRQLALLAVAQTPWALVGCGAQDAQPQAMTKQGFYTSVEACERDGNSAELCRRASQAADTASTNDAPRYKSKADCIAEYGDLCTEKREASGGFWMPLMTGFMLSQMLSPGRAPTYLDSNPIYRTRAGQYTEAYRDRDRGGGGYVGGGTYGTSARAGDGTRMRPVDIAPNRAVTMSRSGFGSASAARSGWGGSSRGG